MCGICGVFNFDGLPVDRSTVEAMSYALRHRGPDGSGTFVTANIGLGHRRLSIIDIAGGAQPVTNEDGSLQLVFNGEIYNYIELRDELRDKGHVFKTDSDTEVIIHGYEEWGFASVNRFNGIFAFALWDGKEQRLFVVRDHLGVKPLYHATLGNCFLFASEVKAILSNREFPRDVDITALRRLFTYRYVPSPGTLFAGVSKLPPGHYIVANKDGVTTQRFWKHVPRHTTERDERILIEQYQCLLEDAVRLQLRSDVPVGLFLSSGVDSSSILAVMTRLGTNPIHTFTIGFENGQRTNETDAAREIAQRYGADHEEMMITAADYEKYYDRYLWDIEEPVGNETAAAFYFVSRLASRKVKVVLTGQGADEPWAGYHRHLGVKLSNMYRRLPNFLTDIVLKRAVRALPRNERLKRGVNALHDPDLLKRFNKIYSFFTEEMKNLLFQQWIKEDISYDDDALVWLQSDVRDLDPLSQILYIDARSNLPDDLLMVGDKTSMANSLEARVPFLDYRLVEFIESLPPELKLKRITGKYLHKKALEKWLPKHIVYRKKKGFANPIEDWFRSTMKTFVDGCLLSSDSAVSQYFDQQYIKRMLELDRKGTEQLRRHIYLLVSFELWHRAFISKRAETNFQ